jgi:selenide, water dikinase
VVAAGSVAGEGAAPKARPSVDSSAASEVVSGQSTPDDPPAMRPPPGMLVVQSVDYFRACLDDPFVFGEIAAAHALSSVYAAGANPWTALAIAAIPYMPAEKIRADLAAMMRGAQRVLAADGCTLIGGHSTEALETSLGFAVSGLAEPRLMWRKSGLHDGHALVLTKPLGTGVLLAGHLRGMTKARWLVGAIETMRRSNGEAARVLRAYGATACTSVGAAGLAGDLAEMLRASGLGATIRLDAVPLLLGAAELAEQGLQSAITPHNRRFLPAEACGPIAELLADPQTSGGLLAGVPAGRAESCVAALRAAGFQASVIGFTELAQGESSPVRLFLDSEPAGDRHTSPRFG